MMDRRVPAQPMPESDAERLKRHITRILDKIPPAGIEAGYVDRLQLREDGVILTEAPPTGQFSRVPAQAESGEVTVEQFLRGRIDTLLAEKEGLKSRTLAAEARCRELEGEVADWRKLHDGAQQVARDRNSALNHVVAERDRLHRAAETAREALLKIDSLNDNPRVFNGDIDEVLVEALATLSAALGGKE